MKDQDCKHVNLKPLERVNGDEEGPTHQCACGALLVVKLYSIVVAYGAPCTSISASA